MELFIQVIDGKPVNHPAFKENLEQAFPDGIPVEWEPFKRVPTTLTCDTFEKSICEYVKDETGIWTDYWHVTPMTDEEREEKTQQIKDAIQKEINGRILQAKNAVIWALKNSNLNAVQVWEEYLSRLQSYAVESVAPVMPRIPQGPRPDENYNLVLPSV
jgi:hypothetical protein